MNRKSPVRRAIRYAGIASTVIGVISSPLVLIGVAMLIIVMIVGGGGYSNAIKPTAFDCGTSSAIGSSATGSPTSPVTAQTTATASTPTSTVATAPTVVATDNVSIPYTLPAASGTTGLEETVNAQGQVPSSGAAVTWAHFAALGSDYQNYYLTMRWNYVSWNFDGTTSGGIDQAQYNWFSKGHDGKPWIVTVTNPRTHQAVNLAVIEAGPAPWVGVADSHHHSNADAARYGWTNPTKGTPAGWKGVVAGMPQAAITTLGAVTGYPGNKGDVLYYAWAADQNAVPGPTGDTAAQQPTGDTPAQACNPVTDCSTAPTGNEVPPAIRTQLIVAGQAHNVPPAALAALYLTEQNGFTFEYRWYDTGKTNGAFQLSATDPAWKLSIYRTSGEWPAGGTFRGPFQFGPIWESTYQTPAHPDVLKFADAASGAAAYMAALGAKNNPTPDQIRFASESYNGQTSFSIGDGIRNPDPAQFTTVRQLYADQVVHLVAALAPSFTAVASPTTPSSPAATTANSTEPVSTAAQASNSAAAPVSGCQAGSGGVTVNGVQITIPTNANLDPTVVGKMITAPSAAMARGLAAGFAELGVPYVYGGGTNGGPPDEGCARAGGAENSCQGTIGLDCSGLTGYILAQAGFHIPDNSDSQRAAGTNVPWSQGQPGDIIGFPGHVAIYLGDILHSGTIYILEAPDVGKNIRIVAMFRHDQDNILHRYWT